ncbi:hypothetical protein [Streptomyces sp. NPDC048623]|uniref:hypothetical protein n=1 Tax=Streptomyces sp. NPDC048623 TaxID=3155761 RepID=UPI003434FFD3
MLRHYGVDLLDWYRGDLSSRRLTVLVKHLPQDGAVQREIHGESAEWSLSDHLLAAAVDHLAVANWMFQCVNSDEDGDQPEFPKPVPRPGVKDEDEDGEGSRTGPGSGEGSASGDVPEAISPLALAQFFG